ncbi:MULTISPECIES: aromatic ring-hydroxylating dioxygenase subunit alpha [unclassified Novosphingobium]|uniref:aromatic ring-hydroxylating oxygenase subunit alpha n=1 Tax=unclassified Novosphingobium TaxID=2644732 RepID=UPI001F2154B7|nr:MULTISPECIES: SRPBCC family protein [unclassified Novosphingobium]
MSAPTMPAPMMSDSFIESLSASAVDLADAVTLPPECYTGTDFYEFEKDALYFNEWQCVGRESWIAEAGEFFTTRTVNEPIIVARNLAGEINAMSAVCQHRAMLVAEGAGKARGFLCPYHHWSYSLDGALVAAPAMNKTCNFDRKENGLPRFAVEIWNGFIFVNFDLDAAPLAPRLTKVADAISGYDLANAEGPKPDPAAKLPWNWKVMFENNNDGYHASRLHAGPLHDFVPSGRAEFPHSEPEDAGFLRFNGTLHADASFNATQRAVLPVFPGLTDEGRSRMTFANVPPSLSLVMMSDMVIYLILRPDGPESHELETGFLFAPGAMAEPNFENLLDMNLSASGKIIAQDMHVDGLVQEGLRSRFAPRGRYSWQEGAQGQFNKWLVHRYRNAHKRLAGAEAID